MEKPICKKDCSPKLSPIWQGQFVVKNKLSDLNYIITNNTGTTVTVHINYLKPCLDHVIKLKTLVREVYPKINDCTILQIAVATILYVMYHVRNILLYSTI